MKTELLLASVFLLAANAFADEPASVPPPALTIYNKDFAVVRDAVPLDLKQGENRGVTYSGMTATAETDSVILRDADGKVKLQVLEQSYRNDPVSDGLLLSMNEGKGVKFVVKHDQKPDEIITGTVVRSGYVAGGQNPMQPVIDVNGVLQFSLPGEPRFDGLGDGTILNPTMTWKLNSSEAAKINAEIAYVTSGLSWHADYNIVGAETSDVVDLVGWVTFNNNSGKTFKDARIKLMAGDVNKLPPPGSPVDYLAVTPTTPANFQTPAVLEKAFSEFHLYTIANPTTLRDHETKQVEFVRAQGVKAPRIFVYDGASMTYGGEFPIPPFDEGVSMNKKVWVLREFKNSQENKLGMPLPNGRLRFYEQDDGGGLEFIGENEIDHTSKDETVRVYVGNSFDLTGERRRTDFKQNQGNHWTEEAFEIKLRNHKKEAVEIRAVEHMSSYGFNGWTIKDSDRSDAFTKLDSHTIEFRAALKPDEEKVIKYRVRYTW
ncbi:MAG TPA: DUF4139 domain-containing protein [Chthoniobacteraceae bacterium]|nr:DUF4139 domain-containing protein [Chthoniobacteraceae bacterium]